MGLIDLPSSRDFIESVDWVIPADQRGFSSQTSEPYYSTRDWAIGSQHTNVPVDYHAAEDAEDGGDPFTTQVQTLMKNNPISFPYAGPVDGKTSGKWYDHLRNVLIQFGWALKKKFPDKTIPTMVTGSGISQGGFMAAMSMLNMEPEEKQSEDDKITENEVQTAEKDIIKSFQSFFSKSQPIIGQLYSGEIDGEMSFELMAAAKAAESAIANTINDEAANGALINVGSKKFNTSVSDLQTALDLIQKHHGQDRVAFLDSKGRILAFSAIINQ
ncbi:hypothetical protein LCGC14_1560380 [marine sediment metagenome]|uniref:Uncharacterized protein n=1 Tax=marine sediment metagenome TaxID=412755 RepID=A0A0F9L419_9ZZZZ